MILMALGVGLERNCLANTALEHGELHSTLSACPNNYAAASNRHRDPLGSAKEMSAAAEIIIIEPSATTIKKSAWPGAYYGSFVCLLMPEAKHKN